MDRRSVTSNPIRLDSLTGLRWWAAFAVFMGHMRNLAPIPGTFEIFQFGNYGVMFFFILSGFVLTWSATKPVPVSTFYVRRFARIWPAAFVTLLLALPVFYSFSPDPEQTWVKPVNVGILLLSIPLLQGWFRDPVILFSGNPATWTLTIEFFFYSLHPFINRALQRLTKRAILISAGSVVALAFVYRWLLYAVPTLPFALLPLPVLRLNEFILGMLVASAMRLGWRPRVPMSLLLALLAALVLLSRAGIKGSIDPNLATFVAATTNEWLLAIFTLMIVSAAARELGGKKSAFSWWPIVKLGEWSFAFYLVHATLIYAARGEFGAHGSWGSLLWYPPLLLASIGLAALVHLWVEKPMERKIRYAWDARRAERPAPAPNAVEAGLPGR